MGYSPELQSRLDEIHTQFAEQERKFRRGLAGGFTALALAFTVLGYLLAKAEAGL